MRRFSVSDPTQSAKELGLRIAKVAELLGGKRALAKTIEVSEAQLYRYINGATPGIDVVLAIAEVADVRLDWLMTGSGPMQVDRVYSDPAEGVVAFSDVTQERVTTWIREWWASATADQRTWFRVQIERTFPEFVEWQKKQDAKSRKQSNG
jgi:transcriptional regulator with XRE-family HTH domain